jgi:predicted 2-oxoglutarate/Fe(II)-dependent dioxygenase YbiX
LDRRPGLGKTAQTSDGDDDQPVSYFLLPGFLDEHACAAVREAMDRGASDPAEVLEDAIEHQEHVRRTLSIEVDAATLRLVEDRLEALRERLSSRFGAPLGPREGTGFLRYLPGGFYRPHRDRGDLPSWPGAARRQIAVVLFLNSAVDAGDAEGFRGGVLRLYRDAPGAAPVEPLEITPSAGTLVAFPATVLHEVTRVEGAIRDAAVDWFY